jgi:hypothetical protein
MTFRESWQTGCRWKRHEIFLFFTKSSIPVYLSFLSWAENDITFWFYSFNGFAMSVCRYAEKVPMF